MPSSVSADTRMLAWSDLRGFVSHTCTVLGQTRYPHLLERIRENQGGRAGEVSQFCLRRTLPFLINSDTHRSIGVSNFNVAELRILLDTAKVVPAVNQVSLRPTVILQRDSDIFDLD